MNHAYAPILMQIASSTSNQEVVFIVYREAVLTMSKCNSDVCSDFLSLLFCCCGNVYIYDNNSMIGVSM